MSSSKRPRGEDDGGLCVVCSEEKVQMLQVECGHRVLCAVCTIRVLGANKCCPMCRTSMLLMPVIDAPEYPLSVEMGSRALTNASAAIGNESDPDGIKQALMALSVLVRAEHMPRLCRLLEKVQGDDDAREILTRIFVERGTYHLGEFLSTLKEPRSPRPSEGSEGGSDMSEGHQASYYDREKINLLLKAACNDPEVDDLYIPVSLDMGPEGVVSISTILRTNTHVTSVSFDNVEIGDEGVSALGETLRVNNTIAELFFESNSFGGLGIDPVADALAENTALTKLVVQLNTIGGASAIARALRVNKTLRILKIAGCDVGTGGALEIADALAVNTALEQLEVSACRIGRVGVAALTKAFEQIQTLSALTIQETCDGEVVEVDLSRGDGVGTLL